MEQLEDDNVTLREKLSRSPSKAVVFAPYTTDLEGSNQKVRFHFFVTPPFLVAFTVFEGALQ